MKFLQGSANADIDSIPESAGGHWLRGSTRDPRAFTLRWWVKRSTAWRRTLAARGHWLALSWLIVAITGFAVYAQQSYPLGDWAVLFWARAWLGALAFGVSSLAIGLRVLALLRLHAWSFAERSTVASALGVLTFALGIYLAGLVGCLGSVFFVLWPLLLLLLGAPALALHLSRFSRAWRKFGPAFAFPQSVTQALAVLLVAAGAFALYLQVITPNNIGFDARWYHLTLADDYAAAGAIRPFPEGWFLGAYPQLASWLYTWAFLAPGALKHHLCLAAHLEFLLLLATVGGVSVLAARFVPGPRLRFAGAAMFLFPAIFVYDSNLNCGADHVLAFWAAPLGVVLLRYLTQADSRHAVLLGLLLAGATLTKYQAVYFLVPIALVLIVDLLRRRQPRPVLVLLGVALAATSPHWLKNWIAYGDPLYPNLYRFLPDHPFFHGASSYFEQTYWFSGNPAPASAAQKLRGTVRTLLGFSFSPLGWGRLPDPGMVIGSLFTLLLPLVLWIRPRWRVLLIVGCAHGALAVWYLTYPYDRYLQAFLPWMAACTAASLATAWRKGPVVLRVAVAFLVALQLAWGGDAYFLRSHAMLAELPLHALSGDPSQKFTRNPYPGEDLTDIGAKLPKGSRIVGHDFYQSLGAGVPAICDQPGWQGGIDYLQLDSPADTLRLWRQLGATHLVSPESKEARAPTDLARDAVFCRTEEAFTDSRFTVAGYRVARLVDRAPSVVMSGPTRIAWLACGGDRTLGIYTPAGLADGTLETALSNEALERDPSSALAQVNAAWLNATCAAAKDAAATLSEQFVEVMRSGELSLRIRNRAAAPSPS